MPTVSHSSPVWQIPVAFRLHHHYLIILIIHGIDSWPVEGVDSPTGSKTITATL
jgi:hypothetical protein